MKNRSCSALREANRARRRRATTSDGDRWPATPAMRPAARRSARRDERASSSVHRAREQAARPDSSTARNARWPARICHSGLIAAPTVCATPRMMPPASVPQSEAEAADDDRLEGVDQPRRADGRIEIGAHAEKERGDRHHHQRNAIASGEDPCGCRCPSARRYRIVGGGAEGAAERGAVEQLVERDDDGDGRREGQQRQTPILTAPSSASDAVSSAPARAAAVGGKSLRAGRSG